MNLKEIEYIVRIAEEGSLNQAAEKLYITPSALNQQLLRLEREIGAPLFLRSRAGWLPTRAGEIYLKAAREILCIKQDTYLRLQDVVDRQRGTLTIGLTPRRSESTFLYVYPRFHEIYPEMTLSIREASVRKQQRMIAGGEIDIGFMSLEEHQRTDDHYERIFSEEVMLFIAGSHPLLKKARPTADGRPEIELSLFREEAFALIYPESTLRDTIDRLFTEAGFEPNVLFESGYLRNILNMVRSSTCCSIGTLGALETSRNTEGITFCHLPGRPQVHLEVSYRKGLHLSEPAKAIIAMVSEEWLNRAKSNDQ